MTPLPNNHYAIEVPEGARSFQIDNDMGQKVIWKEGEYGVSDEWIYEKLPPGSWEIISLASEISEEQIRGIVESYNDGGLFCRDYALKSPVFGISAAASFRSLLTSLGLGKEYLIIVKNKKKWKNLPTNKHSIK
jgi:hypothetical protein